MWLPLGLIASAPVQAQALNVVPVIIELAAGQRASSLTVVNQGDVEASFQLRAFRWSQFPDASDTLTPSVEVSVSPPLGTIPPGASQLIRIIVRSAATRQESSYRLLLDQIPAPATLGTVRMAIRLSMPVFVEPAVRATPHLLFHVERITNQNYLVVTNNGNRHEKVRDIVLKAGDGTVLGVEQNISPYVLAGATRRWQLVAKAPLIYATLRLTAHADSSQIANQLVTVQATR